MVGEQAVITEIRGKEIVINRGSSAGVRSGSLYRVYTGTKRNPVNLAIIRIKDVRENFSNAEIIKNGGKIELLRRVDKIEAVSKEEANSIIKRKKLAKKRPNEKIISANKERNISQNEVIDFEKIIAQSIDNLEKQTNIAFEQEDYKLRNDVGKIWVELGNNCLKYVLLNEFGIQLTKTGEILKSTNAQEQNQKNIQEYNKNAHICFLFANKLFELSLSSKKDNPEALNNLGLLYGDGAGVEQDEKKAVEFFTKAAAQGHANAYNNLGYMYMEGLGGLKKNIKKAVELYRKSAEQEDPKGLCSLGYVYMEGLGVKKDSRVALKLFNRSVAKGYAGAYINLGSMYVVSQDANKALECFKKAAVLGDNLCLEMALDYLFEFFY